ncbi:MULTISPECIES: LacI family DNA-binding transcriptional regulator [Lactiplantibacillus]|uniref:LacI family DNA-binding transcriptional regulator n=1 Tax=Lactiplantibacillus pentosus TaxID=1589 RepID=A0AAW8WAL4_LACPE|nr:MULTISPECIES: LacI family DNA-binding transcriptional regulator [Lactiplantibacillus]AUI77320.1 LacI family transcriptional regulator [Lactiplantibacillus pentosus]MBU7462087.1 LacI family DNA-binding transcriptional regulator [Lactiplantibacillus pentosus]MBU7478393.1 LacI family DNA-binding transcriptional regulator [Lactiplantibacillus pentosus]MBU7483179.1 LacI family DNA-binding transcriptional regulator [Lactiplantibacillus sp. 30.2.29]MBU7486699.1 LacI family DNA-binding transcriptio
MTTLSDVAKQANVSKMTVSRVINHPEQVRDELKQSVFEAMKELNYRPNVAAQALVNNRTQIVKLFILEDMDTTEPYYMNLLAGIAKKLGKEQYSLQLITEHNFDIGGCDGYIITGMRHNDYEWIRSLERPVVLFGENRENFDYCDTNNQLGVKMATDYAIKQGYQTIEFIGMDVKEPFEYSREAGYMMSMQEHRMATVIHRFDNHSHLTMEYIQQNWGRLHANTCYVCASDRLAFGIEKGLSKLDANIPIDFGIIGFDGVFLNQVATPKITTVQQPIFELGLLCAEMLLAKIAGNGKTQGVRQLTPVLSIGGSTRNNVV